MCARQRQRERERGGGRERLLVAHLDRTIVTVIDRAACIVIKISLGSVQAVESRGFTSLNEPVVHERVVIALQCVTVKLSDLHHPSINFQHHTSLDLD